MNRTKLRLDQISLNFLKKKYKMNFGVLLNKNVSEWLGQNFHCYNQMNRSWARTVGNPNVSPILTSLSLEYLYTKVYAGRRRPAIHMLVRYNFCQFLLYMSCSCNSLPSCFSSNWCAVVWWCEPGRAYEVARWWPTARPGAEAGGES